KIEVSVSIYSYIQAQSARPGKPKHNDLFTFDSSDPLSTFHAQLLVILDNVLCPPKINISDYRVQYSVPRHSTPLLDLGEGKYDHMLQSALKAKKDPKINLTVTPITSGAKRAGEDVDDEEDEEAHGAKRRKKKSKIPNKNQILPGNKAMNEQIGIIRERWKCPSEGRGPCGSTVCFIRPNTGAHYPLNHAHNDAWSSAILKGAAFATIDSPPNTHEFDDLYGDKPRSSLLQQRIAAKNASPASTAPVINVNFPADMFHPFNPVSASTNPSSTPIPLSDLLLPAELGQPGPKMTIEDFCAQYCTDNPNIYAVLHRNNYTSTTAFRRIKIEKLESMGLMGGDIAALQEAVEEWVKVNQD
ncbi:hypothetical protein C8J56DRAFT_787343, partial [Mycena floridula]